MRRGLFPLLLAVIMLHSVQRADACGDKFVLVGRAVRFQHAYAAVHPARIVLFASPGSGVQGTKLQVALERAGHQVSVVTDNAHLSQALKPGNVDLVLASWGDLSTLKTTGAVVLPIMNNLTKADTLSCRQQYDCQLKSSDKVEQYLGVIENTMKQRAKDQKDQHKS